MARLGISLMVVWIVGCGESPPRPAPPAPVSNAAPVASAERPDARKLLLGDGVPRDRDRALALYDEACQRGDAPSCGVVIAAPGVAPDRRTAATDVLWRRCQAGEVWSCRTAADRGAFAAPEATVRAACDRGFAYACTTLAAKTSDAALRAKACRLGDPAACFDGTSDPQLAEQGMAILDRNCEAGVAIDCVALGKRASGDVRARAARRAVEAAVQGCLAADLTACVLAQDATEPASDLEIRTMACALEPSNCQTLALRQFKANDIDGARRSYELSCLTDVRDYHYDWRASDCVAGAKLFRVVNDPARAAELMKKACALGNQHACGAAQ